MDYFRVANLEKYQHYKQRNPPWVKLHSAILDDYDFSRLPDATKWLAVGLILLASKNDNKMPADPLWIRKRLSMNTKPDLESLVEIGFLQVASKTLASCKQDASNLSLSVRGETEESRVEEILPGAEGTAPGPHVRIRVPATRGDHVAVTDARIREWQEAYPGVYVEQEIRRAIAWLEANPTRLKTPRGTPRFLVNWLSRAQDRSKGRNQASTTTPKPFENRILTEQEKAELHAKISAANEARRTQGQAPEDR